MVAANYVQLVCSAKEIVAGSEVPMRSKPTAI